MTSSLAESALARRFFIGPLVALALAGPTATTSPSVHASPTSTPTPSASPSPGGELGLVVEAITKAYEAERVYYVDNLVYAAAAGGELKALQNIEARVRWGRQVAVEVPARAAAQSQVLILRAPIPGGGSLCISEVSEVTPANDENTWYARVTGKAHCPPRRPHMPGWTTVRKAAWGI